jgi:exosortase
LQELWTDWNTDSYNSHGILVPLIVLYLVREVMKNKTVQNTAPGRTTPGGGGTAMSILGLVVLMGSLLVYFVGTVGEIVIFQRLALVVSLQSAVLFVFGWSVFRMFLFPLFFLFFMIPVPVTLYSMVALPMQLFATKVSGLILGLTPLPITVEGNIIRVGDSYLEVAEACSGLRSLLSFIMLSLLFAYLANIVQWKKVTMVLSSIPIAIAGNIVRILFTTVIAYIYGTRVATGFIHDASGYVMFVVAFCVFFWLSRKLEGGHNTNVHE